MLSLIWWFLANILGVLVLDRGSFLRNSNDEKIDLIKLNKLYCHMANIFTFHRRQRR